MEKNGRKRTGDAGASSRAGRAPSVLRGNALATLDDDGRLKLPAGFRRTIEETHGRALYLSSLLGDSLWVYPLAVWQQKERRLLSLSNQHPAVSKFLARTSYFGAEAELDAQGRVVVPAVTRASAKMSGEVAVLGALDHLEVWSHDKLQAKLASEPFTTEDFQALAVLGL